jgi:hypothetical protein
MFKINLEVIQSPLFGREVDQLQLLPFARNLTTHPTSVLKTYVVPVKTRLKLTISKDIQAEEDLSGAITIIRVNHLSPDCRSAVHRSNGIAVGVTPYPASLNKLDFRQAGVFLEGERLNEIQIVIHKGAFAAKLCCCPCTLHVTGKISRQYIDSTIHLTLVPGLRRHVNKDAHSTGNIGHFHMRRLYSFCSCEDCRSLDDYNGLDDRQLFLYKLSKDSIPAIDQSPVRSPFEPPAPVNSSESD